ncbi:hypothetical protein EYF80_046508 [Liparis tanakae]|uniref:Uncharacterized protein n=1 Tax=Liparis tanakae TaxID=230148 RepID=A0A4Z2FQ60_9TELE|nr:hypothetical protein EYF80_046508 [Liparis tanakae]
MAGNSEDTKRKMRVDRQKGHVQAERVDAVLSAELLEVLRDGVCGSEKSGIMRPAQNLKPASPTQFYSQL